ncbi:lipopolysaccharide biosynthesis protein [Yeosuana sp. AK3]
MKQSILKILKAFGVKSIRTKNIVKHVSASFFYKGISIVINFLLVPLLINYLDTENYGVWLTLSSFIGWFTFFDIGLGNGLRNRLAETRSVGNLKLARAYVSTAYFTILTISIFLFLLFMIINNFIDWAKVFNSSTALSKELSILMPVVVGFFCLQLVAKLIGNIYLADQNHSIQVKIHFVSQLISLLIIWILIKTTQGSLLVFGIVFSAIPVFVLLGLNLIGFTKTHKDIRPIFSLWKREHLKDIMGIGFNFFILQIAGIILFSTDNFIISKLFSPEEVVPYNIAFKYFSILTMIFSMVIAPYWSSITEAYVKKEYDWIKISIKNISKIWLLIPFLLGLMLILSKWFYNIWIGDKVIIPLTLSISMAFFVLLFTFNSIFVFFINGVSKIKLQLIVSVISMIANIPLSIFFAKNLDLGLSGVILASTVAIGFSAILSPIQYFKIINFKAKGIWNR